MRPRALLVLHTLVYAHRRPTMYRYSLLQPRAQCAQRPQPLAAGVAQSRSRSPSMTSVIVGGGGHGLATAYYLASHHGVRNVAVLEKGWIGGGNTGRNTTIVRSNYLYPRERAPLRSLGAPV